MHSSIDSVEPVVGSTPSCCESRAMPASLSSVVIKDLAITLSGLIFAIPRKIKFLFWIVFT